MTILHTRLRDFREEVDFWTRETVRGVFSHMQCDIARIWQ